MLGSEAGLKGLAYRSDAFTHRPHDSARCRDHWALGREDGVEQVEAVVSYVAKVLQPGEQVVHVGRLHWIMYLPAIIVLCLGLAVLAIPSTSDNRVIIYSISGVLVLIAALSAFRAWFRQFTTEIAVTDRRIIYKIGFISRHTAEMNMHRVETVAVEQGIIGRMLNYGTVHIRGTGAGIENLTMVANPLGLRSAITAPAIERAEP
jgi:membrane protein YdbS with pleckstrin-like domain